MENFDGNSFSSKKNSVGKDVQEERKNLAPITNQVKVKKETELKKFTKQFISEDVGTVKGHIITNVIIPSVQKLISDLIRNTVDGIIYGVRGIRPDAPGGMKNIYNNYNKIIGSPYYGAPLGPSSYQQNQNLYSKATVYSVDDVEFFDRGEAENVLYSMRENIQKYGVVSVGDFYDLISQKHAHTDFKYGWRDLQEAEIIRIRSGYQIKFPRIIPLD